MKKTIGKGFIFVNGFYRPKGLTYQIDRFTECFLRHGVEIEVIDNQNISVSLEHGNVVSALAPSDFIIYLDKDKHIAYMLEKAGYRLFNPARGIELSDDKIRTYIELANHGIEMPKTYSSPILYREDHDDAAFVSHIEASLNYPLVVKEAYGSLGMQVYLVRTPQELRSVRARVKLKPHLYQEYVGERFGTDARVIVVGGKTVSAILRKSDTDFRSNIELGGKAYPLKPPETFCLMAERASEILGLDYCGVDILFGRNGEPVLCEVNSNAFFSASEAVTGVDIAGRYTDYIVKVVYGNP